MCIFNKKASSRDGMSICNRREHTQINMDYFNIKPCIKNTRMHIFGNRGLSRLLWTEKRH